jgi:hypothetical protein
VEFSKNCNAYVVDAVGDTALPAKYGVNAAVSCEKY